MTIELWIDRELSDALYVTIDVQTRLRVPDVHMICQRYGRGKYSYGHDNWSCYNMAYNMYGDGQIDCLVSAYSQHGLFTSQLNKNCL